MYGGFLSGVEVGAKGCVRSGQPSLGCFLALAVLEFLLEAERKRKERKGRNQMKFKYSCIITLNMLEKCLFKLAIIDVLNYIFK